MRAGLSQADAAEQAGIHVRSLRYYEHGDREPNMRIVRSLAQVYGMDPARLLNDLRSDRQAA